MVNIKINNTVIYPEFPIEYIADGTEDFNLGTFKLNNLSKREAYPDYADVILTINGVDYEACISKDISTRIAPNLYNHNLSIAENVIKLKQYKMADRRYTTKGGSEITYLDQLENILLTQELGKASVFTINEDTQTLLNVPSAFKEYAGGDLLITLMDLFRSVNAVPTLNLDNEIGHTLFQDLNNLISIGDIVGEVITSDIADYGLAVHSKIKNGTYEKDEGIGWTYFPSKNSGVTCRSKNVKFDDKDAMFEIDSGVRRAKATIMNLEIDQGAGSFFVEADISNYLVSKEEWDNLIHSNSNITSGVYKNNTMYWVEGDNIIYNFGVRYTDSSSTSNGILVQENIIHSWLVNNGYLETDWVPQQVFEMEIRFYYQPMRDMDVRVERHNIDRVNKNATVMNNQKDSIVELSRYGKALKSHINRIGNDTYEVTKTYNNFTAFTLFELNDYTSDGYKIIKRHMIIRDNSIDVSYLFVKNASMLNPFTAVNSDVTPFTITKKNILSCFVRNEYFEFSATNRTNDALLTTVGKKALLNALKWDSNYDKPILAAQFNSPSSNNVYYNMTATHFPLGTSLVFNAEFKHPKFAGHQLIAETSPFTAGYRLEPVSYGDINGEVDTFELAFYNNLSADPNLYPVGSHGTTPLIDSEEWEVELNPDEMLGVSSIIHLITDRPNLIVGDFFAENNSLIKVLLAQQGVTVRQYSADVKHTIFDRYAKSGYETTGSYSIGSVYKVLTISGIASGKSWAICNSASPYQNYLVYNYEDEDLNTIYLNSLKYRPNVTDLTSNHVCTFETEIIVVGSVDMSTRIGKFNYALSTNTGVTSSVNIATRIGKFNQALNASIVATSSLSIVTRQTLREVYAFTTSFNVASSLSIATKQALNQVLSAAISATGSVSMTTKQALNQTLSVSVSAESSLSESHRLETTATPTIHDYIYAASPANKITYYVRNNDDATAEILSDYDNPPTTDRGDIATTDSTSQIILSAPTPATVYATAQASGKYKSAYTSQYVS